VRNAKPVVLLPSVLLLSPFSFLLSFVVGPPRALLAEANQNFGKIT
jgi:hypothetical protein